MKRLLPHPFAELLPLMSDSEYQALKQDIGRNGQQDDIIVFEGKILDGRNRERVCFELKKKPRLKHFYGKPADALNLVYSKAVHRNMTDSQKAAAAVNFLPHFEKQAISRMKSGGTEKIPEGQKGESRNLAGGLFGVSGRYVSEARAIKDSHPKLFADIFSGKVTVSAAKQMARVHGRHKELKTLKPLPLDESNCRLILGDVEDELQNLPTDSVDLIFTDPPYNIGKKYDADPSGDAMAAYDFELWLRCWILECRRILKPGGSMFVMMNARYAPIVASLMHGKGAGKLQYRNTIYWWENNPENQKGNFSDAVRQILYFVKGGADFTFNDDVRIPSRRNEIGDKRGIDHGKLPDNVWIDGRIPGNSGDRVPFDDAPPQLPLNICETIVRVASNPGDTVLDPFNGNGITGIAALLYGRKYIGIDRSKKYLAQSRTWIGTQLEKLKK